jgi:hypothetical protein
VRVELDANTEADARGLDAGACGMGRPPFDTVSGSPLPSWGRVLIAGASHENRPVTVPAMFQLGRSRPSGDSLSRIPWQ